MKTRYLVLTGCFLVLCGGIGFTACSDSTTTSTGIGRVASIDEIIGLYGACGNVGNSRDGCGLGSCKAYCEQFDISGSGNVKQNVANCSSTSPDACGSYHDQQNCR